MLKLDNQKTDGKGCASNTKLMVTSSTARYAPSADATFTYANIRPIQKLSSQLILRKVENERMSPMKILAKPSNALDWPLNTQQKKGFQLLGLIHTLLEVGAQTHSPSRDIQIHKSKKWVDGAGRHSRNISGKNWHVSWTGCPPVWKNKMNLST